MTKKGGFFHLSRLFIGVKGAGVHRPKLIEMVHRVGGAKLGTKAGAEHQCREERRAQQRLLRQAGNRSPGVQGSDCPASSSSAATDGVSSAEFLHFSPKNGGIGIPYPGCWDDD